MASESQPKPATKQKEDDPIVRLGDVRDLTGRDPNGNEVDDGSMSGYHYKSGGEA